MYSLVNNYIENLCMIYGTYLYNIKNPEFIKINTGYFTGMQKRSRYMEYFICDYQCEKCTYRKECDK